MNVHAFEPSVVQVRRHGDQTIKFSRCRLCHKPGREFTRAGKSGRVSTYWQHGQRPKVEPSLKEACSWEGAGQIWCCKANGHDGGHHAHRGPRRNVHDAR